MSHPMNNRMWVTQLYLFAWQSHQSLACLIPLWPTGCEWHYCISVPEGLINHVSSHDQQDVSDTALFLCQAVSSIMSHTMANSKWVTLLYFFSRQSHQSCLITVCEQHCFISLSYQPCLIPWPTASERHCFFLWPLPHHPMANRL